MGTDHSSEALTVQGSIQVAGEVLHPSDQRIKKNISPVDPEKQLENVQKIQVVEYQYKPEYLANFPEEERARLRKKHTGVIAQELRSVLPDAVESAGDLVLQSGHQVDNMLIVNKDRLFLENIGAVRQLSKVTDNLGHRIDELETRTVKMSKLNRLDSVKSSASLSTSSSAYKSRRGRTEGSLFRNRWIQGAILCLVGIMTLCLLAMATLYVLEYQRRLNESEEAAVAGNASTLVTSSNTPDWLGSTVTREPPARPTTPPPRPAPTRSPAYTASTTAPYRQVIGKPHDCLGE